MNQCRSAGLARIVVAALVGTAATAQAQVVVGVRDTVLLTGVNAAAEFEVSTEQPATLSLRVTPLGGGAGVIADSSAGPVRAATLRLVPSGGAQPRFPSGGYWVDILVRAPGGEERRVRYAAVIEAPPVQLTPLPDEEDIPGLLPEVRKTPLSHSLVAAVVVTGGTIAASRLLRPDSLVRYGPSVSSRSVLIGISLGAVVGLGSQLMGGRRDPRAVAINQPIRDDFRQRRELLQSTNAFLLDSWQGVVILRRETP